jgi:hypothetical protein
LKEVRDFPNEGWWIPYEDLSEVKLETKLKVERRKQKDPDGLRQLEAALELKKHPIPEWAGYREAAELLRFTRYLMGKEMTMDAVVRRLRLKGLPQIAWNRWENGVVAMPDDIIVKYARLLVKKRVLTEIQGAEFVTRMLLPRPAPES